MNNLYMLTPVRMIRVMRIPGLEPPFGHFFWRGGVWALDSPASRQSLETLVDLGNTTYGTGTHWIEEHDSEASCPFSPPPQRNDRGRIPE